ncbi:MAG TPA: MAPEG family protein [Rhodocyclaceae bacterium]|nr:MAPEG family protein [Rhodocyclaceae bacterium]
MVSSIYAALLALSIVGLSLNVIKLRRGKRVLLGDGDDEELQYAIRAQGNATEYIPISLILLILLELSGAHPVLIHLSGLAILAGRIVHARGLLQRNMQNRILGMKITFWTIIMMSFVALIYASRAGWRAL